jgi:hypothetical protein
VVKMDCSKKELIRRVKESIKFCDKYNATYTKERYQKILERLEK